MSKLSELLKEHKLSTIKHTHYRASLNREAITKAYGDLKVEYHGCDHG